MTQALRGQALLDDMRRRSAEENEAKRAWDAVRADRQPREPCAGCGHSWGAHCGHTFMAGQPEPHHCSQLCGCRAFVPRVVAQEAPPLRPLADDATETRGVKDR